MNKRLLSDGVIELHLAKVERNFGIFPIIYFYDIFICGQTAIIGRCDYRVNKSQENYYAGNIGYMILPRYRGNHYAYRATKLLGRLARSLGAKAIYITCSPENTASYRTIKKLNTEFIEEVAVPENHYLYRQGEKIKQIFLWRLDEAE